LDILESPDRFVEMAGRVVLNELRQRSFMQLGQHVARLADSDSPAANVGP